jgi:hypothetical protein
MVYMCHLFRGAVLGQEVQCLKVLGLRVRDHVVVMPGVVQVVVNMTLNPVAVALVFSIIALVDHVFPTWCLLPSNGTWHVWCFS